MKRVLSFVVFSLLLLIPVVGLAEEADSAKEPANVYVFYGKGCHFCEGFFTWVNSLSDEEKAKFNLVKYETWYNTTNNSALEKAAKYFKDDETDYKWGVPYIIIGRNRFNGFVESMGTSVLEMIDDYYNQDERADLIEELQLEVVADATTSKTAEKTKTAVIIFVVLAICLGAGGLIYVVSKSEE